MSLHASTKISRNKLSSKYITINNHNHSKFCAVIPFLKNMYALTYKANNYAKSNFALGKIIFADSKDCNLSLTSSSYNSSKKRTFSKLKRYLKLGQRRSFKTQSKPVEVKLSLSGLKTLTHLDYATSQNFNSTLFFAPTISHFKNSNLVLNQVVRNVTSSQRHNSLSGVNTAFDNLKFYRFKSRLIDYVDKSFIDFLTFTTGSRAILQFYPFLANNNVSKQRVLFYKI